MLWGLKGSEFFLFGPIYKNSSGQAQINTSVLRLPRLSTVMLVNQPVFKKVYYLFKSEASSIRLKHYLHVSLPMASATISTIFYGISSRLIN